MADHKETDSKKGLNADELALWKEMTRDVERLEGRDYVEHDDGDALSEVADDSVFEKVSHDVHYQKPEPLPQRQGIDVDRQTMKRLKRGDITIEGRLDLHGMGQPEARQALIRFVREAYMQQKRCVLVVTGKGNTGRSSADWLERKPGVLRRNVPHWLREGELSGIVLQFTAAQPKDGGDGALYVYLRRQRG